MKFLVAGILGIIIASFIIGPEKLPDNRPRAIQNCKAAWKDSGYKWRLRPYTPYMNSKEIDFICQVNVEGRWVDSQYVKVG